MRFDRDAIVTVATGNAGKLRELLRLWGSEPPLLIGPGASYVEVAETGATYEENALLKAVALSRLLSAPALADDSGIEVEALQWGPGVLSARTPSPESSWQERNTHIIAACNEFGDVARRARFVCVCALVVPGVPPLVARGEVEGTIARAPVGDARFGYDPIFNYPPFGMTFAQAGEERKDSVSHRGLAVRAMRELLQNS
jgi:XTP/dITP diphosphohydrolase